MKLDSSFKFEFNVDELKQINSALKSAIDSVADSIRHAANEFDEQFFENRLLKLKQVHNKVVNELQILTGKSEVDE